MLSPKATLAADRNTGGCTRRSIVAEANFVRATRDTGYKGTAAAICELVDNALQARATTVHIIARDERKDGVRRVTIGVLDNGMGMSSGTLHRALQFGGTDRFDDRSSYGRYGMGLPNASLSQTKRFEVYSWTSPAECVVSYLDVDEVAIGMLTEIPAPASASLPKWVAPLASTTGTLVVWADCDRLSQRKASTVAAKLELPLGRIYRRAIWNGLQLYVNGRMLRAVDPLYHNPSTGEGGAKAVGEPLRYEMSIPDVNGGTSLVTIRFTLLPVEAWHPLPIAEKRRLGVIGGAGVSILRAGREIAYGWYLMGGKRRENYDDWWRCEVSFDPSLDEMFGVTHSKQGVSPTARLKAVIAPDLEAIARELNTSVRRMFERTRTDSPSRAVDRANERETLLPPLPAAFCAEAPASDRYRYRLEIRPHDGSEFFVVALRAGEVRVSMNADHPFVQKVYSPAMTEAGGKTRFALESAIIAAARARLSASTQADGDVLDRFFVEWGDALAAFVDQ